MTPLGRRAFLGGGAALLLPRVARAQAARFRGVSADTSPIAATGGGSTAAALRAVLDQDLARTFADLLAPRDATAPLLVARVSAVYLSSYGGGVPLDQFGQQDSIEGDGLVVAGGRTLSTTHVLTELSPGYSGAYYTEGIDRIRLASIAHQFAYWLRREMGV